MKVVYTSKAAASLKEIAFYLRENHLTSEAIKAYVEDIREGIHKLLTTFPEAGVVSVIDEYRVRKVMVKNYSVLYDYDSEKQQIYILLVYKHNLPILK